MGITSAVPTFATRTYLVGAVALAVATGVAWLFLGVLPVVGVVRGSGQVTLLIEGALLIAVVSLLAGSSVTYLVARVGASLRWRSHERVPREGAVAEVLRDSPALTVLIPSYKEEPKVVWRTVMSAALQEYPELSVVVLIDDPPEPADEADAELLRQVKEATEWVDGALGRLGTYLEDRHLRALSAATDRQSMEVLSASVAAAVEDLDIVVRRLRSWADDVRFGGHESEFFSREVVGGLAADLDRDRRTLAGRLADGEATLGDVHVAYRRLRWIVGARVSTFERKRYASLSHEANKAMNINAYLGLMGGSYVEQSDADGTLRLLPSSSPDAWHVPRPDFVLTLDADSALVQDYCLRLVEVMLRAENRDVAVTQTPYCAFPGPATALERVAGATTDLLHVIHQGKTYYGATFWVGANAVIRAEALEDIAQTSVVDGTEVTRFIQDRTVIEDTESTVDLLRSGWRLLNYPERLAYSATPPDFGSLVIQRRRWANGGLLILPKLLAHARESQAWRTVRGVAGFGLQVNYLASIAVTNLCLLVLLLYPFDERLLAWPVLLLPVGYFMAMTWDLVLLGYRPWCAVRIYAMNLLLLPVNLAGVVKSLQQAATGAKIPFARTPKVADRVAAPALYVLAPVVLVLVAAVIAVNMGSVGRLVAAVVAGVVAALLAYAVVAYVTPRAAVADVRARLTSARGRWAAPDASAHPSCPRPMVDARSG